MLYICHWWEKWFQSLEFGDVSLLEIATDLRYNLYAKL